MDCPNCQFDNREGAKFCKKCGNKLEARCPSCGHPYDSESTFCDECGHNLAAPPEFELPSQNLTPDDKLAKIERYLPQGLADKILSQRDKIEGERKNVTVMFCDLEGFTTLSEKLDPEDAYALMDQVYEILIHKVHDFEGTVNEMTGDGIMALFGAPIALEDAPQRAIRAALAIHREMVRFNDKEKQKRSGLPTLRMRIGIHTGPVVVGTLGNDLRVEFKAVGDTVNLASRMEGLAQPGTIYVSGDTFQLTEGLFRFEGLGEKEIKGKEEPVSVYRVIAPSTRRTRFDVSAERGLTPFVGRERELELLLDAFERVKEGRGQAVSIVADAGVGKSRLLYEFRKAVANEDVTFLEGKSLSYSRTVAYHPMADILKGHFDIREDDGEDAIREKVRGGLKALQADESLTLPYLLELLTVKDSGIDKISLSPEGKRDQTIQALGRIVLQGAEIRPLILAVEDLHWVDNSSEDALKNLLDHIAGARVLLIFSYRPEYIHTWGGRSYHNQVNLNRLSNRDTLTMVAHILGSETVPEELGRLILEKTEGVPFFVEEFLKSLKDLRIIEREDCAYLFRKDSNDVTIPATIQEVIMARVDALSPEAKEVLQTGAVIEREFSHVLLRRVTALPETELLSHLSALKDAELIYERGVYPQSAYIFKHALTRQVIYDSILSKRKRQLHEAIGKAMEDLYQEDLSEHVDALCEHFMAGGNYEKGAVYSRLAARKARRMASLLESIEYAKKRIVCLERSKRTEEVQKRIIDARVTLGLFLIEISRMEEAKEAISGIIGIAEQMAYKRRLAQIYTILGGHSNLTLENYENASNHLQNAIRASLEENDTLSSSLSNYHYGLTLANGCEFKKAVDHTQIAVDINAAAGNYWGLAAMKSNLSTQLNFGSMISKGYQTSYDAIIVAEKSGDPWSKGHAYTSHGISLMYKGDLEKARVYLLKGLGFCERINLFSWMMLANWHLGDIYYLSEEYDLATQHYSQASKNCETGQVFPSCIILFKSCVIRVDAIMEEKDVDLELLRGYVTDIRMKLMLLYMYRIMAEILIRMDDVSRVDEGETWLKKALETDAGYGTRWGTAQDHVLYGDFHRRKGEVCRAREHFTKAIEIFQECSADGWAKRTEGKLGQL